MNKLLTRQLKRHIGKDFVYEDLDPKLQNLIQIISETYDDSQRERVMLERTMTINTEELNKLLEKRSELLISRTQENEDIINLLHQYKKAIDLTFIVSITNVKGIITFVNKNFCEISGYSEEDLIGNSHNIVRHPNNPSSLFKDIWDTISDKRIWNGTFPNLKKNGSTYYVKSTIIPLLDVNGNIKEYMALREDITKEKIYQEKLQLQTHRINTIFNSQENIVMIVDLEEGIKEVNNKFLETFYFKDLNEYQSSNKFIYDYFKEENNIFLDGKQSESLWFKNFLNNTNENHILHAKINNTEYIYRIQCKEISLNNKTHYLSTFVDITELEKSRAKAKLAEKTKSIFLANMSHEVRTPLNAIIGFSDILTKSTLTQENQEYSEIILNSAQSLHSIIDDVLDISKIESGKLNLEKESFLLGVFIENIINLFSVKAKEKNIKFIYESDPKLPYSVIGDSSKLRQVISNLLSNAIKFTPQKGKVVFSLKLLEEKYNHAKIKFLIKDTGIGMNKEQKKIIFEPFSQADNGISREYGGTGLGLAICKDIINLMHADIKVKSKKQKGSKFFFVLDLKIDKERKKEEENKGIKDLTFSVLCNNKDNKDIKENLKKHLKNIAKIKVFNKNTKVDILFCIDKTNIIDQLKSFKKNNPSSLIIYIGQKVLNEEEKELIQSKITFPIYGSKIFNIISNYFYKKEPAHIEKHSLLNFGINVLVAEDNKINQKLIKILLNKLNITCTFANNGKEAISLYKKQDFALIFMDINMPILDGVSATKKILNIQKKKKLKKTPIIALTANSIEGDKEKYISAGMSDYISKPIEFTTLISIIKKHISTSNAQKTKYNYSYSKKDVMKQLSLDEETVDLLLKEFFLDINKDIKKLEKAIISNNYKAIISQAHYIKGSCSNLRMTQASIELENIENLAKEEKDCNTELNELKEIFFSIKYSL